MCACVRVGVLNSNRRRTKKFKYVYIFIAKKKLRSSYNLINGCEYEFFRIKMLFRKKKR